MRHDSEPAPTASEAPRWHAGEQVLDVWHIAGISPRRQRFNQRVTRSVDATIAWCTGHWLLVVNLVLAGVVAVAIATPVFFALGWVGLGQHIFDAYHFICAQIPYHSYFLFGYQMALCARNLAIYGSLLGGSLLFQRVRRWWPALDWKLWLLTMVPMAWDGGTQLFGWRESNWEIRTLTGAVFGLGVCWFLLPLIEDAWGRWSAPRAQIALAWPRLRPRRALSVA